MKKFTVVIALLAAPVLGLPTISSVFPRSGPAAGGTFVHIMGSDLMGFALACPALECANYVRFGDTLGAISSNTQTEIVAVAPPHAAGIVDLTVNIAGKATITLPAAFRYEAPAPSDLEQVLLPLVLGGTPVPGAFASMWIAVVTFHNASDIDIPVDAPTCGSVILYPCPPPLTIPAGSTVVPTLYPQAGGAPGVFIAVPRSAIQNLDISLRIQDTSRQEQTWGTAIPIVRPTDFRGVVRLNDVPTDSRFRLTLRVYGYLGPSPIRLRLFHPSISMPLVDVQRDLSGDPPSLQIDQLAQAFPQLRGMGTVRVEVASELVPPKPLWAFISVTNNETQHVTVIAPSP